MNVRELIEVLRKHDGDAVVGVTDAMISDEKISAVGCGGVIAGTTLRKGGGRPAVLLFTDDTWLDHGVMLSDAMPCEEDGGEHAWHDGTAESGPTEPRCSYCGVSPFEV
jgi:hypothetical protein